MRNYLKIGYQGSYGPESEVSTEVYGIYISGTGRYKTPAPKMTLVQVPGKTGPVAIFEKAYESIEITYPAFFAPDGNGFYGNYYTLDSAMSAFTNLLLSYRKQEEQIGYHPNIYPDMGMTIADTYDTQHYRLGYAVSEIEFVPSVDGVASSFELTFSCDPRRFNRSEQSVTVYSNTSADILSPTVTNDYEYPFSPVITVQRPVSDESTRQFTLYRLDGSGGLTLISIVTISGTNKRIVIDCERQICYEAGTYVNLNKYVSFSTYDFPKVPAYSNLYVETGSDTVVHILPKRWTL